MKITVCIGSSCHLKGSRKVVEEIQRLILENNLKDKIEVAGIFCMGNCQNDVGVTIDGEVFSVHADKVEEFFNKEVISRI